MTRGGKRPNTGRPAGAKNKRTVTLLKSMEKGGITPLGYMLGVLRDETADTADRKWAAGAAASFLHPRPAPEERRIEISLPDVTTPEGVGAAISAVVQAVAKGLMAPGEAQKVTSVLQARLIAIETTELAARITKLEEKAK